MCKFALFLTFIWSAKHLWLSFFLFFFSTFFVVVVCFAFSAGMTQMTVRKEHWCGLCNRVSPLLCRRGRRVNLHMKRLLVLDSVNSIFNSPLPAELNSERPDLLRRCPYIWDAVLNKINAIFKRVMFSLWAQKEDTFINGATYYRQICTPVLS